MKRILSILFLAVPMAVMAQGVKAPDTKVFVIYENDPHSTLSGYPKMVSLKDSLLTVTENVLTVSGGDFSVDFFPGDKLGNRSKGVGIIKLMNKVGYDYVVPGNHDFDNSVQNLLDNMNTLSGEALCCNCLNLKTDEPILPGYAVRSIAGIKLGFVGVANPKTISKQIMKQFIDSDGNVLYSFCEENLCELVQSNVDKARSEGADYVIVLSHLGDRAGGSVTSLDLIANTTGIDVVLDAHSHSVIPDKRVNNKDGKPVLLTSTGLKFANIGVLTIGTDGNITPELISTDKIREDADMQAYIEEVEKEF